MTSAILQVSGTQVGQTAILQPMQFDICAGEHIGIIGPNGAGKTTLLRALAGLTIEPALSISLASAPLQSLSRREIAHRVAYLSQTDTPDPSFRVRDYIALARVAKPECTDEDVHRAADVFGLTPFLERSLATLSGGERQRVLLARCLAQRPQILLLDEPTNHLDISARLEILAQLRQMPITLISVLHDLTLVSSFADRVLMLQGGRLVADDVPETLFSSPAFRTVFGLRAQRARLDDGRETLIFTP